MPETGAAGSDERAGLTSARRLLDGLDRPALQRLLYTTWLSPDTATAPRRKALAQALVHLRRTGEERYSVREHLARSAAEARTLRAGEVRQVRDAALPARTPVYILGEHHTGTVMYLVIGREAGDPCPAPWYVVAVEALRTCRAHGAEEIEPLVFQRVHGSVAAR